MKRLIIAASLLVGLLLSQPTSAQVRVNVNIGSQPVWGPVGYDYVEYYYLPDIDMYYHVPTQQYVYLVNRRWVYSRVLPPHFRNYDFYRGYKVVINRPRPYLRHNYYRNSYVHYRNNRSQHIIRDSRDSRYYGNPGHPKYNRDSYAYRDRDRDESRGRYEQYKRRPEPQARPQRNSRDNNQRWDKDRDRDNWNANSRNQHHSRNGRDRD